MKRKKSKTEIGDRDTKIEDLDDFETPKKVEPPTT
jgi:hypothetical protein